MVNTDNSFKCKYLISIHCWLFIIHCFGDPKPTTKPPVFHIPLFPKEECFLSREYGSGSHNNRSVSHTLSYVGRLSKLDCCMLSPPGSRLTSLQPWILGHCHPPPAGRVRRHSSCQMKTERFAGVFSDWSRMSSSLKPPLSSIWEVPISSAGATKSSGSHLAKMFPSSNLVDWSQTSPVSH